MKVTAAVIWQKVSTFCKEKLFTVLLTTGLLIGAITGLILRYSTDEVSPLALKLIKFPSDLIFNLLKAITFPLVATSIASSTSSLDISKNGRLLGWTIVMFIGLMLWCSCLSVTLMSVSNLAVSGKMATGNGAYETAINSTDTSTESINENETRIVVTPPAVEDSIMDVFRNMFPDSMLGTALELVYTTQSEDGKSLKTHYRRGMNFLGVIVYSLCFGIVVGILGDEVSQLRTLLQNLEKLFFTIILYVIWLTPLAVACLLCSTLITIPDIGQVFTSVGMFLVITGCCLFIHVFGALQLMYYVFLRKNPFKFLVGQFEPILTAFSLESSMATLPITMKSARKHDISEEAIQLVCPLGATVHMCGTCISYTTTMVFVSQLNDVTLTPGQYVSIILMGVMLAMAGAPIPGAGTGLASKGMVALIQIGIPQPEAIFLILPFDWFLARIRTSVNILGDLYVAAVIDSKMKSAQPAQKVAGSHLRVPNYEIGEDGVEEELEPMASNSL